MIFGRLESIGLGPNEVLPEQYSPRDRSCFAVQCFLRMGTSHGPETQDQRVLVCSPTWLTEAQPAGSVLRGQGLLLMTDFDAGVLRTAIDQLAKRCTGPTREEVFQKLGRLGFSEFEDYNRTPIPLYFIDEAHESDNL